MACSINCTPDWVSLLLFNVSSSFSLSHYYYFLLKHTRQHPVFTFRVLLTLLGSLSLIRGLTSSRVESSSSECRSTLTSIISPCGLVSFNLRSSISTWPSCVPARCGWKHWGRAAATGTDDGLVGDTQVVHNRPMTALTSAFYCLGASHDTNCLI